MACVLLVGSEYMSYLVAVIIKCIINIENGTSGVAEDCIHALLKKAFEKYLRTIEKHCKISLIKTCRIMRI